eukprot:tig00001187_g7455.t1
MLGRGVVPVKVEVLGRAETASAMAFSDSSLPRMSMSPGGRAPLQRIIISMAQALHGAEVHQRDHNSAWVQHHRSTSNPSPATPQGRLQITMEAFASIPVVRPGRGVVNAAHAGGSVAAGRLACAPSRNFAVGQLRHRASPETLKSSSSFFFDGSRSAKFRLGRSHQEAVAVQRQADWLRSIVSALPPPSSLDEANADEPPALPARYVVVALTFLAFLVCNMDKVNMSVAILPMAKEYGWSATTMGIVQSSFFYGYILTQTPGGALADRFGGRLVLGMGVLWWSIFTAVVPWASQKAVWLLLLSRVFVGLGEGVAPPAITNLLSKWVPVRERSRATALVFSGMNVGSVAGLILAPYIIDGYGWPAVFYVFGLVGVIWYFIWTFTVRHPPPLPGNAQIGLQRDCPPSRDSLLKNPAGVPSDPPAGRPFTPAPGENPIVAMVKEFTPPPPKKPKAEPRVVPWATFFRTPAVWAQIVAHFCGNWGYYILLSWMPSYFSDHLGFDVKHSSLLSVLPYLTMSVSGSLGGLLADFLVSRGKSITFVRKFMQSVAFLGPACFLALLTRTTAAVPALLCLTLGLALSSFNLSGLYCNAQDIAPKYAGVLLGISNTAGALPGIVGVALTGYILDTFKSWNVVFYTVIGFYIFGTIFWNAFATGEKLFD